MKRFFALVLCLLFLLPFVFTSCKSDKGGSNNSKGDLPKGLQPYDPPIDMTFAMGGYFQFLESLNAKGWTLSDNIWLDHYREELGINLTNAMQIDDIQQYFEALSIAIAAGNVPDLVALGDDIFGIPNLKAMEEAGILAEIGPAYEEYATPELKKIFDDVGHEVFYPGTFDGKIKTIPWITTGAALGRSAFWLRKDWLETLGLDEPTTMSELTEILRQFTESDPDGDGNKNTYGFIWGDMYLGWSAIFNCYGATPEIWVEKNGKLEWGSIQPEMKPALAQLANWYKAGYMNTNWTDPESNVIFGLQMLSDFNGGVGGCIISDLSNAAYFNKGYANNENFRAVAVPAFKAGDAEVKLNSGTNVLYYYGVNTSLEHPEAVIKMFNLYVKDMKDPDMYDEYFKPVLDNGNAGYGPCSFSPIRQGEVLSIEKIQKLNEAIKNNNPEELGFEDKKTFDQYMEFQNTNKKSLFHMSLLYGDGGSMERLAECIDKGMFVNNKFQSNKTPAMQTYSETLWEALMVGFNQIIMGEQPVEYFDELVNAWYESGGQEMTDEANAWYQNIKK